MTIDELLATAATEYPLPSSSTGERIIYLRKLIQDAWRIGLHDGKEMTFAAVDRALDK
jgi:hypothetical protein